MGTVAQKQCAFIVSILVSFFSAFQIIHYLSLLESAIHPEVYLTRIALYFCVLFLPILGAWFAFGFVGSVGFSIFASVLVVFSEIIASSTVYIWFLPQFGALCFLLYRMDIFFENRVAAAQVDLEKYQNERNDLESSYKSKGEGISILFEKYSTYYNLRKLAEELAASLSVDQLSNIVVERTVEFIPKGRTVMLSLIEKDDPGLKLVALRAVNPAEDPESEESPHEEDAFDQWVIKNRRRLIVTDAKQDFRFDIKETSRLRYARSVIMAPLLQQGVVIGSLRMQSDAHEAFSNDDLRLLDTISVLATSAISNAMLFTQTEELAIRDSLTGVYVRRYFFARLKEEHRRALITKRSLSILMCDLDHFKEKNDQYGHTVGDLLLVHFTDILKEVCESGVIGRYGGEEFVVALPNVSKENAAVIAEEVRARLEDRPYSLRREEIRMTVSIGLSTMPEDALDRDVLMQLADQALYEAKKGGRNRVCSNSG